MNIIQYIAACYRRAPVQQRLGAGSRSVSRRSRAAGDARMEVFEGNPVGKAIWDFVWKLPIMKRGEQGAPIQFGDVAHVLRKNIEQIYGAFYPRSCLTSWRQTG